MKKTRTLNGKTILVHRNDGLRKRCDCARRAWSTCPHPWHFSFKVRGGKHHRFTIDRFAVEPITTRDKARTEADRLRALIRGGWNPDAVVVAPVVSTPADLTFEAFMERWRERARAADPNIGDSTRAQDAAICTRLGNMIISGERLGGRPIGALTEDDFEAAFAQLADLAASTWNKYANVVRMMQAWGIEKGHLTRPWVREQNRLITHRSEQGDKRDRRLAPDQLDAKGRVVVEGEERRLLAVAGAWLQRLIIAALETAMRKGELLSLTWADVNLSRGVLTVRAENAKSGVAREVPISQRLQGVLAMVRDDPDGKPHKATAYVFGNPIGEQVQDPKRAWATAVLKAHGHEPQWTGSKALVAASREAYEAIDLHFHDLRHEAGSRWLERGIPLNHIRVLLGHTSIATTSRYLNADAAHVEESFKRADRQSLHPLAQTPGTERSPAVQQDDEAAPQVVVN